MSAMSNLQGEEIFVTVLGSATDASVILATIDGERHELRASPGVRTGWGRLWAGPYLLRIEADDDGTLVVKEVRRTPAAILGYRQAWREAWTAHAGPEGRLAELGELIANDARFERQVEEWANELEVSKSWVHNALRQMRRDGWIRKDDDGSDRVDIPISGADAPPPLRVVDGGDDELAPVI